MQVDLSNEEIDYLINALDAVVRRDGLASAQAALSVAVKLQIAKQDTGQNDHNQSPVPDDPDT